MAEKRYFIIKNDKIEEKKIEYTFYPGFSASQKQKNIREIHEKINLVEKMTNKILEVSSKSEEEIGIKLSAFNLFIETKEGKKISVESLFQAGKVFENGGPYIDLMLKSSKEAKQDSRLKTSGKLKAFCYNKEIWELEPKTLFYDWLYINALAFNIKKKKIDVQEFINRSIFTDVEFNHEKSLNCQARSVALFIILYKNGILEECLKEKNKFKEICLNIYTYKVEKNTLEKLKESQNQLNLFQVWGNDMNKKWEMSFDLNTLEHLGVKLYTQYPMMIAELISNSWDADATEVIITLDDKSKMIEISDNGHSMDFEELNQCFLNIGRNRRVSTQSTESPKYKRLVLGKKGIGKLSMFGIANKITIVAVKNKIKNSFIMEYSKMKASGGTYSPEAVIINKETDEIDGTTIILEEIKRKSNYIPKDLSNSLSQRFSIFDELKVKIIHNNNEILVKNQEIYESVEPQFEWEIPGFLKEVTEHKELEEYFKEKNITGMIYTSKTPLKKSQQGVVVMARKKLAQENAFFDDRSNDYFHSYIFGVLNIDFIDAKDDQDFISTDRRSLVWEGEELEKLQLSLNKVLQIIEREWRKKREEVKKKDFKENCGIDVDEWLNTLSGAEKKLAGNLSKAILNNSRLDNDKAIGLFNYVQDAFSLQSFKEFAEKLSDLNILDDTNAIKLLDDWQFIEAKELAKLSQGRINTIDQFGKYIEADVSETKVMQKFLEQFPWILEPRMTSFEREVTYSRWLKEQFPETKLEESNKRIDFLCSNNNGTIYIVELKRPSIKISFAELQQVAEYSEFIKRKLPDSVNKVVTILISENHSYALGVSEMVDSMVLGGRFEIKSYSDLLSRARSYHGEFIKKYENLLELKEKSAN